MVSNELAGLVDDYLRVIVRTRPWTRAREETHLMSFCRWVQASEAPAAAAHDIAKLLELFLAGLPRNRVSEARDAVIGFRTWAAARGQQP